MVKATLAVLALLVVIAGGVAAHDRQHANDSGKSVKSAQTTSSQKTKPKPQIEPALQTAWQAALAGTTTPVDIAVYDHGTGETAHYSTVAAHTYNTASIMKLSILENLLLTNQQQGTAGLTQSQLADAAPMIEHSDNDAATALWQLEGGTSSLDSFFQKIDATQTSAGQASLWGLTQTTALDQLKVVNELAYPKLLNAASVQVADTLLDNVESDQRWGVSGGVPSGVTVRLKNGWLDYNGWTVNSIGHVQGNGTDYTIAVLTDGDATEQTGINLIQALSTATWKYLSGLS